MKKCFVFCHGFGFDNTFWKNLAPYFSYESCLYIDLGYSGNKRILDFALSSEIELVGIGHSLGLIKLLSCNIKFKYLIGLNGFINFLGFKQEIRTTREVILNKLVNSFATWPVNTMLSFYKNCGLVAENEKISRLKTNLLMKDLEMLFFRFSLPPEVPVLIIGAKDDIIVPPSIIDDNFQKDVVVSMFDKGAHGLGFFEAENVFNEISRFIKNK
jgi:pimeloyl-[acyl-carrier protein] methyl ester esterase